MNASDILRLEARNFQRPDHWDWGLTSGAGEYLAHHEVRLDPESDEYRAMTRLEFHVRWQVEPERPIESEAEFLGRVGQWMGEQIFGDIGRTLVRWRRPVTVLVVVPPGAEVLRHWPLELAWVDGQALAMQEVSLVFDVPDGAVQGPSRAKEPIGKRLRMLGVFSLPAEEPLLLLSQQRYELVRSIERVAASTGTSVSLVTVQHGVTRKRLREILKQGEGWDVIHFSGHGLASRLLLEGADGRTDLVTTDELLQTLGLARSRLKLLVLSSCESGAAADDETIRAGASPVGGDAGENVDERRLLPAVAVKAAQQLDCAVLGMRYRVSDDFSIELAHHLYDNLLDKQNALPRALQLALLEALEHWPEPGKPPLSVATPALFGSRCVDLRLEPPAAEPSFRPGGLKMSHFDREPELFVGRVQQMTTASRALAPDDRFSGVLFHATGQTGKTACAVELAYLYKDQFSRLVQYQAPARSDEIAGSLVGLAESLEAQLEQFGPAMKQATRSRTDLERFLPRLKELMERHAILVLIDGIEELLTTEGNWRDKMWGLVIDALLDGRRASRLVLTSRRWPARVHDRLLVIPVPSLSPEEALLLARQLPNLGAVLRGRTDLPMDRAVTLLADTLAAADGMPGTLYEADKQFKSAGVLDELPARIAELARASGARDETTDTREEYLQAIREWKRGIHRRPDTSAAKEPAAPATSARSPAEQDGSAPSVQASAIHKPKRRRADPKKEVRAEPRNEVQLTLGQHGFIPAAENSRIPDDPTPGRRPDEAGSEPQIPDLRVLSGAKEYHSALSRLVPELNALYDIPGFPWNPGGESIFKWKYSTIGWLAKAEKVLAEASGLAAIRESQNYPSVRLAQAADDANAGLEWVRQLVARPGESSETGRFLWRCEETVAAISKIVAYAAGSLRR